VRPPSRRLADKRIYDIYFAYPYQEADDITWNLPSEFRARSLPDSWNDSTIFGDYTMSVASAAGAVHVTRRFTVETIYLASGYYAAIRAYFGAARLGDESQVVLEWVEAPRAQ